MRRSVHALVLSFIAAVPLVAAGGGYAAAERASHGGRGGGGALYFAVSCGFSHRNQDDPIVYPRQPGRSHDHTFFANTSTNAASTPASLRQAGTTCNIRFDTAAYWVPTLFVRGQAVRPTGVTAYYVRRTVDAVQAFPPGLKMIAGNHAARSPQGRQITAWSCGSLRETFSSVPTCSDVGGLGGLFEKLGAAFRGRLDGRFGGLQLLINFPSCWNGRDLDSSNHQSHMAYPTNGVCPGSHPVEVPGLLLAIRYPIAGGPNVELASGGQFSGHGDFVNSWNQQALQALVSRYLNRFG